MPAPLTAASLVSPRPADYAIGMPAGDQDITLFVVVGAVVVVALIVGLVLVVLRQNRLRREALLRLADDLGCDVAPDAPGVLEQEFTAFHLFRQGYGRKARDLLQSRRADAPEWIFEYRYTTGGGQSTQVHRQTVIVLYLPGHMLPQFELRPENVLHRLAAAFGFQDVDFAEHPEFSKRYLLRGANEDVVRGLFNDALIAAVSAHEKICVEGGGPWLVIYRAGKELLSKVVDGVVIRRRLSRVFLRR
ncbi:MAG: hypothetical protein PVJ57_22125 [Phycisphaerae bacterium]